MADIGRPSKYDIVDLKQVEKLCRLGATDKQIADFYEVNEDTVYEWKKVHPEFSEALKKGKLLADANVANSLYHRAIGYEHEHDEILMAQKTGTAVVVKTIKHYPPDTTAAIFWLKNRRPGEWRDKQEVDIAAKITKIDVEIVKNESED